MKTILEKLIKLNRLQKKLIFILFDSVLFFLILLTSFSIRLGYWYWPKNEMIWIIFVAPVIAIPIFISFRLYQTVVRYIGVQAFASLAQAITLYSVIWGLLGYMAVVEGIPRSVILINWMLSLVIIGGYRLIIRWIVSVKGQFNIRKNNVIIYGAGSAGRQLSHALQLSKEYKHVAYVDENLSMDGTYINNIPVYLHNKIPQLVAKYNISEILIALPLISHRRRNKIIAKLSSLPIQVRSLPSLSELTQGKVEIGDFLKININDLLHREQVKANTKLLKTKITGKVVLVTGAGGSIGSELCRQIYFLKPKKLILFENNESALYQIEQELNNIDNPKIDLVAVLGSIGDKFMIKNLFNSYDVETIYHAAAYKHVPLVEDNPAQGVLNNVMGTMTIALEAIEKKIDTFVLISTDKAVRPTSVMGATKRVSELVLQALSKQPHDTCFTMVRFGNVLDSSGSVIPLFKKQIKQGGPITVTDIDIVRYFMTIPEAVELVIQAGAMSKGGDVFVLDMGKPVKIYDLALKMIHLSGLQLLDKHNPDGDIEIKYTGLRPGEKLYEELLVGSNVSKTDNKMIMRANEEMINWETLNPILKELQEASISSDINKIKVVLMRLVPEYLKKNVEGANNA